MNLRIGKYLLNTGICNISYVADFFCHQQYAIDVTKIKIEFHLPSSFLVLFFIKRILSSTNLVFNHIYQFSRFLQKLVKSLLIGCFAAVNDSLIMIHRMNGTWLQVYQSKVAFIFGSFIMNFI